MSREKQIKSTDWLTRDIPKEQLEREKQEAIMSVDLELCHTEFMSGVGEIYTDYDTTAQKMYDKGYRKQSEDVTDINVGNKSEWISVEERLPDKEGTYLTYTDKDNVDLDIFCVYPSHGTKFWSGERRGKVTHWMPLPQPPKMKGGAE